METTALALVQNAVAGIDKIGQNIAAMEKMYGSIVYDVRGPAGMEAAKADRKAVREPIYAVERIRKEAKRPLLDLTNELDGQAKRITIALRKIEANSDGQITAEENRVEAEKQAKIQAEMKRTEDIKARLAFIRGFAHVSPVTSAAGIQVLIDNLGAYVVAEVDPADFMQACDAQSAALGTLREAHKRQSDHEAERERVRLESEALAIRQREQAEIEAKAAKERKARQDELDRVELEARAKREAEDKARREETDKIDARLKEVERQELALKLQAKPVADEAIRQIVAHGEVFIRDGEPVPRDEWRVTMKRWSFDETQLKQALDIHGSDKLTITYFLVSPAAHSLRVQGE